MQTTKPDSIRGAEAHLARFDRFALQFAGIRLRPYQSEAAQAVIDSIREQAGRSIVVLFSRQAGKDELAANLKAYLLARWHPHEAGIVEVNPTYKPQTINAIDRLERRLQKNKLTRGQWRKRSDFIRLLGNARVTFLSGDGNANVVGAVASLLLIVNEAQDIEPAVYDRNFAPMAASTNATRLFMGTAWTSRTLLGRELRGARQAEQQDGVRRVFMYNADDVRQVLPAYGDYVDGEIARLGRQHPLIKTQYFNEEIDAQGGMFNAARRALMQCDGPHPAFGHPLHLRTTENGEGLAMGPAHDDPPILPERSDRRPPKGESPERGGQMGGTATVGPREPKPEGAGLGGLGSGPCIFSIDVAGQDESTFHSPEDQILKNPGRDAVALTIASVDLSALATLQAPIFRVVRREQWTGQNHLAVFGKLLALAEQWRPQHIIIDATGVGEGLWAMLEKHYPTRVIPVKFSAQKKSDLGYRFLAMIETGRFRDCSAIPVGAGLRPAPTTEVKVSDVDKQYAACSGERASSPHRPLPHDDVRESITVTASMVDNQYAACVSEVLIGPLQTMRWGVPEGTRDEDGSLIHDDIVMADALLAEADMLDWSVHSPTLIIQPKDPLDEMSHF